MRIFGLLLIMITLPLQAQQISGVVVDSDTVAIPYVNIWNMDSSAGATTNEKGQFSIPFAEEGEEIVLLASGYKQRFVNVTANDTIVLQKIIRQTDANELVVYPEKTLHHTIGDAHFENFYFNPGNLPWIFARYFPNNKEIRRVQYINKAIVYTKSMVAEGTFKLRLLVPDEDGCPGEDLLDEPIIVEIRRGNRKNNIDLLHHNLKMPKNGLFVAIEWVLTENNQARLNTFVKKTTLFEDYRYAPDMVNNHVEKSNSYRYMEGYWYSNEQFVEERDLGKEKPYADPAIGLILSN